MIIQQQSEDYKVHEMNSPPLIITLVKDKMNSTTLEEAIFIAHGIILEKDLPPVQCLISRFRYALLVFPLEQSAIT